jgi:hypothetical protein
LCVVIAVVMVDDARALAGTDVAVGADLLMGSGLRAGAAVAGWTMVAPMLAAAVVLGPSGWDAVSVRVHSMKRAMAAGHRKATSRSL